jgi:hypothetical protein
LFASNHIANNGGVGGYETVGSERGGNSLNRKNDGHGIWKILDDKFEMTDERCQMTDFK